MSTFHPRGALEGVDSGLLDMIALFLQEWLCIYRANGMKVWDTRLLVKFASFNQTKLGIRQQLWKPTFIEDTNSGVGHKRKIADVSFAPHKKSYAQAVEGGLKEMVSMQPPSSKSIVLEQADNGWLYRSAFAILRLRMELDILKEEFKHAGVDFDEVRSMGGRHVLITFINKEVRDKIIKEDWWE